MYRKCQQKHPVPRKCRETSNYSSFGQKLSQQSMHEQLKGWEVGTGLFFEGKSWSKERVPWKLIRAQLEVKNKAPKWSCAPSPSLHRWWWNAFVSLLRFPPPELITLSTLHSGQFASNTICNAHCAGSSYTESYACLSLRLNYVSFPGREYVSGPTPLVLSIISEAFKIKMWFLLNIIDYSYLENV